MKLKIQLEGGIATDDPLREPLFNRNIARVSQISFPDHARNGPLQ